MYQVCPLPSLHLRTSSTCPVGFPRSGGPSEVQPLAYFGSPLSPTGNCRIKAFALVPSCMSLQLSSTIPHPCHFYFMFQLLRYQAFVLLYIPECPCRWWPLANSYSSFVSQLRFPVKLFLFFHLYRHCILLNVQIQWPCLYYMSLCPLICKDPLRAENLFSPTIAPST